MTISRTAPNLCISLSSNQEAGNSVESLTVSEQRTTRFVHLTVAYPIITILHYAQFPLSRLPTSTTARHIIESLVEKTETPRVASAGQSPVRPALPTVPASKPIRSCVMRVSATGGGIDLNVLRLEVIGGIFWVKR